MYKGGKLKMWTKERKFATTSKASTPTYTKTVVLTFSKKSIVTLSTRFQAQLLIPMFKNFRALEFPALELPG